MNDEMKKEIRYVVRKGIDDALTKYGIDTDDPTAMQAVIVYLRKSRQGSDEVLKWVKRSTITVAISGMLVAVWQGIKQLINQ